MELFHRRNTVLLSYFFTLLKKFTLYLIVSANKLPIIINIINIFILAPLIYYNNYPCTNQYNSPVIKEKILTSIKRFNHSQNLIMDYKTDNDDEHDITF